MVRKRKRKHLRFKKPPTKAKQAKMARTAKRKNLAEWGRAVRAAGKCAVCGIGEVPKLNKDGTPKLNKRKKPVIIRLQAHHLLAKEMYPEFMLIPINGICLCVRHHKYSRFSVHRNGIFFSEWLKVNRPEQFAWCIANMGKLKIRKRFKVK